MSVIVSSTAGADPFEWKPFSPKQIYSIDNCDARLNIWDGSVSSGKTVASIVALFEAIAKKPTGDLVIAGYTRETIAYNVLGPIENMVGANNFRLVNRGSEAVICGRVFRIIGAHDKNAEKRIRGSTIEIAYCDELTLLPESFFKMMLSRLRVPGARALATTNPDSPSHWLMEDFLTEEAAKKLDMQHFRFTLDDNLTLTPQYVANLKSEYSGMWYDRYILGRWVVGEGAIYTPYTNDPGSYHWQGNKPTLAFVSIGVDFGGTKSATTFVATGFTPGFKEVVILRSERRSSGVNHPDGKPRGAVDDPETLTKGFLDFVRSVKSEYPNCRDVFCDSAEQILIAGLRTAAMREGLGVKINNAWKTEINDRIRLTVRLMGQKRFYLMTDAATVKRALTDAVWDSRRGSKDSRLDNGTYDVDSLDALEYSIEPYAKQLQEARVA